MTGVIGTTLAVAGCGGDDHPKDPTARAADEFATFCRENPGACDPPDERQARTLRPKHQPKTPPQAINQSDRCRLSDMRTVVTGVPGTQETGVFVRLTQRHRVACVLAGQPVVQIVDARGRRLSVKQVADRDAASARPVTFPGPGRHRAAMLSADWFNYCARPRDRPVGTPQLRIFDPATRTSVITTGSTGRAAYGPLFYPVCMDGAAHRPSAIDPGAYRLYRAGR